MKCENIVTDTFLEIGVGKSLEVFEDEMAFVFEQPALDSSGSSSIVSAKDLHWLAAGDRASSRKHGVLLMA